MKHFFKDQPYNAHGLRDALMHMGIYVAPNKSPDEIYYNLNHPDNPLEETDVEASGQGAGTVTECVPAVVVPLVTVSAIPVCTPGDEAKEIEYYKQCRSVFHDLYKAFRKERAEHRYHEDHPVPKSLLAPAQNLFNEVQQRAIDMRDMSAMHAMHS